MDSQQTVVELSDLVREREELDRRIDLKVLEARAVGVSLRTIGDTLHVSPSTALETLNRVQASNATVARDDVVVVAAETAYDLYLRFGVYACQVGRRFRNAVWMGFYLRKTIKPEFPRILHIEPFVEYTDDFVERIATRGGPHDQQLADVIRALRDTGARPAGGTNEIVILTPPGDERTLVLPQPIAHTGRGAWLRWQRYVSTAALEQHPKTTDELTRSLMS